MTNAAKSDKAVISDVSLSTMATSAFVPSLSAAVLLTSATSVLIKSVLLALSQKATLLKLAMDKPVVTLASKSIKTNLSLPLAKSVTVSAVALAESAIALYTK